jgi:hypothetical protein
MSRRIVLSPNGRTQVTLGELGPFFDIAQKKSPSRQTLSRKGVFVNLPYDETHFPIVDAIVFTIIECGYIPRLALQDLDSGKTRIEKIVSMILECKLSIHDLTLKTSRISYPRLNMAFELGLALGAIRGSKLRKKCIIFTKSQYSHQAYVSDISGFDVYSHDLKPHKAIMVLRSFFHSLSSDVWLPSASTISKKLFSFNKKLFAITQGKQNLLTYSDKIFLMSAFVMSQKSEQER